MSHIHSATFNLVKRSILTHIRSGKVTCCVQSLSTRMGFASLSQPLSKAIAAQSFHAVNLNELAQFEQSPSNQQQFDEYEAEKFGYRVAAPMSFASMDYGFDEDYDADSIHACAPVTSYVVEEVAPRVLTSADIDKVLAAHPEFEKIVHHQEKDSVPAQSHDEKYSSELEKM